MTGLTRRRDPDGRSECWHVYYGDVRVGTIGKRAGVPTSTHGLTMRLLSAVAQWPARRWHGSHLRPSPQRV
jgi:hypothetical protein